MIATIKEETQFYFDETDYNANDVFVLMTDKNDKIIHFSENCCTLLYFDFFNDD